MSDIILKSGLRDRNTMRISMDADGDMTLSLDTYAGSAAFHVASQAQIKQLRDYFDSHLAQPAAPQVGDAMVAAAVMAYVQHGKNRSGDMFAAMRAALEAALVQPGDVLAITVHVEDTGGSGLVMKPGEGE